MFREAERLRVFAGFGIDEHGREAEAVGLAVVVQLVGANPERRRCVEPEAEPRAFFEADSGRASDPRATSGTRTRPRSRRRAARRVGEDRRVRRRYCEEPNPRPPSLGGKGEKTKPPSLLGKGVGG